MKTIHFSFLIGLLFLVSCTPSTIKIACVGDSITEGYGLKIQGKTAYPVIVDQKLGEGYAVMNFGRSATTLSKKGDFPYWITKEFANVFQYQPNIITIQLGTNDTKPHNWDTDSYYNSYQAMIDTFKTIASHPKIYLCKPVPVFEQNWNEDSPEKGWGINDSTLNAGVIPAIEKLAKLNNLEIIDLNTSIQPFNSHFPDGIHPNKAGMIEIADVIVKKLKN